MTPNNLQIAANMTHKIALYLDTQIDLGSLVNSLEAQYRQIIPQTIPGFWDDWCSLEVVYASTHYVRDYHTPEETAIVSGTLISMTKILLKFKKNLIAQLPPDELITLENKSTQFSPATLADTHQQENLRLLLEVELAIYFYTSLRAPLTVIIEALLKLIKDFQILSIDAFANQMRDLRTLYEILQLSSTHRFEQTAEICRHLVALASLIEQSKATHLSDPYTAQRSQYMLMHWAADIEVIKKNGTHPDVLKNNQAAINFMIARIEQFGTMAHFTLPSLVAILKSSAAQIIPTPIPELLEQIILVEVIDKKVPFAPDITTSADITAIFFNKLLKIYILLSQHNKNQP